MDHNLNLFGQPLPAARRMDPSTSHAAARSIDVDSLRRSQFRVLRLLMDAPHGMTHEQMRHHIFGWSDSRIRTACSELVARGLVRDSGRTEPTKYGRKAIVWEVVR